MAQDWASDLLRALPLPNDVRSTLWEAAYDDDWDTFQQKVKTAVAPKGDRDARVLESKLRQAARRREEYAQRPPPPEPEERGVLGTAADYAFTSVIPRIAGWLGAEDPSAYSPAQLGARAGDWVNRVVSGEASREQALQAASENERAVLAAFRQGKATRGAVEAAGQTLEAARAQPSMARTALAATAATAAMAPGVAVESLTSPMSIVSAGFGSIPAAAGRTLPAVAKNVLGTGVAAGTALGIQQSAENAQRAFSGGSTEDQILAAADLGATAIGIGTMMSPRIARARVQDVPDVMRQMRAERRSLAKTKRDIKADIKNLNDINAFAPTGVVRAALKQEDMTRLQNIVKEGVAAAGLDLNALPPDVDGFTAWQTVLEAPVRARFEVLRKVGQQLDDSVDLARQNLETAIANDPAPKQRPESLPEWKAWEMARDKATVQLTRDSIRNKLYALLKNTPDAIDETMFALDQVGNVLDPSAPPIFGPMTTRQAMDLITNFINPELSAAGKLDVTTSREYGNRRVSNQAYITGLKMAKQELQAAIVRKAELAGVPNWRELSQDIAVATKMQNRLLENQVKKGSIAQGEQLTSAERVTEAVSDTGPVATGSAVGMGLASLLTSGSTALGSALVGAGRFAGRQMAYLGLGRTKADLALKTLSRMAERGEVTPLPRPSVQSGPTAFLQPGAFNYWPREVQIPSREVQIAQALKDGPPELQVKLTSVGKKGAFVHQVVNPITGQPEKKFGGSKLQETAAKAYANQFRTEDKNYKQLWEMTLRGFNGTDAELADFINRSRGGAPVVSSPAQSSAVVPPPSSPPSSGGGGTPPLPSRAVGVNPQGTGPAIPPTPPPGMVPAAGEITAEPPLSDRQKYWRQQEQLKRDEMARKNAAASAPAAPPAPSSVPMVSRTIDPNTQQLTPMGEFMLRWLAEDVNFRMTANEGAGYLGPNVDTGKAGLYLADAGRAEGWVTNNDPKWTRSKMAAALNTMADTGKLPPSVQQWLKVLEIAWSPEKGAFVADRVSSVDYPPNIKTRDQLRKALPSVMSLSEMPADAKLAGRISSLLEPAVEALGMNLAETALGRFVTAPAAPPTTLASLAAPDTPPAPAAATLAQVAATPPPAAGGATLPPALAGAKPRYNIGKTSYLPEFANDIDRALFIIAQPTRSKQHNAYLSFLTSATGLSEEALVAAGKELRQFIKTTVSGQPAGQVAIPAFSPTRLGGDAPPF